MDRLILWLDLETTSLDPEKGFVIEAAYAYTNQKGRIIESNSYFTYPYSTFDQHIQDKGYGFWDDGAYEMHKDILLKEWHKEIMLHELIAKLSEQISDTLDKKPYLGGSGPHFDRRYLRNSNANKKLEENLYYRHVDVRTLKIFAKQTKIDIPDRYQRKHHRAMDDLKRDINFYKYIIKTVDNFAMIDEGLYEGLGDG